MNSTSLKIQVAKIIPLIAILFIASLQYFNALNLQSAMGIIALVATTTTILITIEESNPENNNKSILADYLLLQFAWMVMFPFYFLTKEKNTKGWYSLIAGFLIFILYIGSGEMYRLGYLNSADIEKSQNVTSLVFLLLIITFYSAPIIISNSINSLKKNASIFSTLISAGIILLLTNTSINEVSILLVGYLTSLSLYVVSLKMAFYKI